MRSLLPDEKQQRNNHSLGRVYHGVAYRRSRTSDKSYSSVHFGNHWKANRQPGGTGQGIRQSGGCGKTIVSSEIAVIKHALKAVINQIGARRLIVTADRGFADVELAQLFESFNVEYVIRVKKSVKVFINGQWIAIGQMRFQGNARHRNFGKIRYCQSSPHRLYASMSRARDKQGKWGVWYLITNKPKSAKQTSREYQRRFSCELGFRDVKWEMGFAQAKIADVKAWSRMFALFAIALLVVLLLGTKLLGDGSKNAFNLMRRVASRRKDRWDLSIVSAILSLLNKDKSLFLHLSARLKFNLEVSLPNVS